MQDAKAHAESTAAQYEQQLQAANNEKEELLRKIADSEATLDEMKNKESQLNDEVESGQADLMKQLDDFKNKHTDLESKVKDGER